MTSEKHDRERADRNHERSEEAHWQVAEAGAEEEERLSEAARPSTDSENEGSALAREPQPTEQGDAIPAATRDHFSGHIKKPSEPERE
jgi:hypothetical protein